MNRRNCIEWSKKELLALPERDWKKISSYDSLLIVPTRKKHNSGYNLFAIIGCNGSIPIEIAGYMDDFYGHRGFDGFHINVSMKGIVRLRNGLIGRKFFVGANLSTTEIWTEERGGE